MRLRSVAFINALAVIGAAGCASGPSSSADLASQTVTDSLAWFNERVTVSPRAPEVYLERGSYQLRQGQTGEAISDFERAVSIDSTLVDDRHALGTIRFGVQDFEGAVREWEGVLNTDPNHIPSLLSMAEVDLLLRSYETALERINGALRNNSRLDEGYFLKGRLYLETGDTAKAASSFQTVVEVNPQRYDAYIQLGLLYASAHDDLALEYFQTARTLKPNSIEALYDEAIYLQEHGTDSPDRYRTALSLYDRILALDASNASAAFNKGFVHLEYLLQYDSAAYWFDEAIARLPYYHQAHYNKGLALESLGQNSAALASYDAALALAPAYTPAALAKGRVMEALR